MSPQNSFTRRLFLSRGGALAAALIAAPYLTMPTPLRAAPPVGFRSLFDGQSLKGWHPAIRGAGGSPLGAKKAGGSRKGGGKKGGQKKKGGAGSPSALGSPIARLQQESVGTWEVRDGLILGGQDPRRIKRADTGEDWGFGGFLLTDETFGDFELLIDARPDWPCDTGIYLRTTPQGQGFQVLLDHRGHDPNGVGGNVGFLYTKGIGAFRIDPYNFQWTVGGNGLPRDVELIKLPAPSDTAVIDLDYAASGEDFRRAWRMNDWNTFRVRVVGNLPRITTWLNDVKICECDTARIKHPNYDPEAVKKLLGPAGHIGLEIHDGPPWRWGVGKLSRWRNIYIKTLQAAGERS